MCIQSKLTSLIVTEDKISVIFNGTKQEVRDIVIKNEYQKRLFKNNNLFYLLDLILIISYVSDTLRGTAYQNYYNFYTL